MASAASPISLIWLRTEMRALSSSICWIVRPARESNGANSIPASFTTAQASRAIPPIVLGTSLRRLRPELGKTYPRSFNPTQLDFRSDDIASILAWIVKKLARRSNACAAWRSYVPLREPEIFRRRIRQRRSSHATCLLR
jgi:hypothetical protein